ncbi:MAG: SipW-dependent-type signal peptide-containing protein [Halobacterium sp.]
MMDKRKIRLSRRNVLAGLGGIGLASVGAGLGTDAYFSDTETYGGNTLVAGELDLMVDWQEHYSDWSVDENDDWIWQSNFGADGDESDTDLDGDGTDDFEVAMVGGDPGSVPSGYVGVPVPSEPLIAVPAEFLDDFMANTAVEAFPDSDGDGRQDLILTREQIARVSEGLSSAEVEAAYRDQFAQVPADLEAPVIDLADVKPGDFGEVTFSLHLFNNPGYIWMNGRLREAAENGHTEPESDDPDEGQGTELLDEIQVAIWHDDGDNVLEDEEVVSSPHDVDAPSNVTLSPDQATVFRGSLREALAELSAEHGIPLDADPRSEDRVCYPNSTTRHVALAWWLPVDHANEIQSDSVEFDLGFYTEQCRHNDGSGIAPERTLTLTGDSPQGQGDGFAYPWDTSDTLAHRGSGSWGTVDHSSNYSTYKQGFYFGGQFSDFDVLSEFTVGEIEEISYWLHEPTALQGNDIYLNIYTQPEGDGNDGAGWYDSRLQALPAEANQGSPNFTPGEWNEFSTATGASNTLTWSDTGHGGSFGQPLPTLDDLQAGVTDWSNYGAGLSTTHDYRDEAVLALSLQTNSTSPGLVANVDDVTVKLANGAELVLDLEP